MPRGKPVIGILLYGQERRNAFQEEKYRALAEAIERQDWSVRTLNFHPACIAGLDSEAKACDALLVWINPIEPGLDRAELDEFLRRVAAQGVLVSAHPDAILKIGTKDVLVETQSVGWTVDARSYGDVREFASLFPRAVREEGHRVLKQYRGNGGQGVWKVSADGDGFAVLSAARDASPVRMSQAELESHFAPVFDRGGHLIDQAWVATLPRGMIRAYLCGTKVAGFGYQEVNALHPPDPVTGIAPPPSTRHYYTESCALFQSLRMRLESHWLPRAAAALEMPQENFPLLWDADFLLADPPQDYVLCEINASCVSPFPPSAIRPMIAALGGMLAAR